MNLPNPQNRSLSLLMDDIKMGKIKIPQFQRNFVWDLKKASKLIDSLIKGYPIGTFIIWKTKEQLRVIRNLGGIDLPEPPKNDYINYVLDGQQRLTSIFAAFVAAKIYCDYDNKDNIQDFSKMYVDLTAEANERIIITNIKNKKEQNTLKINDLLYGDLTHLAQYPQEYHNKIDKYKSIIQSYSVPIVYVDDVPIDVAIEIYTRINEGGKSLSVFEIMVAKTFDIGKSFDLSQKYNDLILKLARVNYDTIPSSTVLQVLAIILTKECSKKSIYRLNKIEFINIWDKAVDSIERAIEYFRGFFRIPVSELLPYYAIIIPFSYFFYHCHDKPNVMQQKYLQDFFWRTSLSERYSHSQESRIVQDIVRMDSILSERQPIYDYPINLDPEYIIENGSFSATRSYCKSILCLYAYFEPKSFNDNSKVHLNNAWLKKSNSRNYHHFFPRSFLRKLGIDEKKINNILNITIVDEHLNKREIQGKSPSKYISKYLKENDYLKDTLKTHLINDIDDFGIMYDDYEKFMNKRADAVSKELKKRILLNKK